MYKLKKHILSLLLSIVLIPFAFSEDYTMNSIKISYNQKVKSQNDEYKVTQEFHNIAENDESCVFCHSSSEKKKINVAWIISSIDDNYKETNHSSQTLSRTSLKCLGCHDGAIASNNLPNGTIGYELASIQNDKDILFNENRFNTKYGYNDLGNNHPVGIIYDDTNPELRPISELRIAKLENGTNRITCGTCHEPHQKMQNSTYVTYNNEGSSLCLDCHLK